MIVMAYTSPSLNRGADFGAEVATCWPQAKPAQQTNDASSGV